MKADAVTLTGLIGGQAGSTVAVTACNAHANPGFDLVITARCGQ